jgi:periplasmic protein TonB
VTHRPPLLTLLASLAVHAAALAVLFLFASGEPVASVLVIDLSELESGSDRPGPENEPASSPRPSRRAAAASVPSAPAASPPVARAPVEPAPPAPSRPEPTPPPGREVVPAKPESRPPDPTTVEPTRDETTSPRSGPSAPAAAASSDPTSQTSGAGAGPGSIPGPQAATGGSGLGVALAPAGPPGGTLGSEYGPYYRKIRQRIQETLEYPSAARRQGIKGTVMLELLIKPDGAITAVVKVSSSHRLLDDAALETVRNLPRQPFPPGLAPRQLTVPLPIVFDLK